MEVDELRILLVRGRLHVILNGIKTSANKIKEANRFSQLIRESQNNGRKTEK